MFSFNNHLHVEIRLAFSPPCPKGNATASLNNGSLAIRVIVSILLKFMLGFNRFHYPAANVDYHISRENDVCVFVPDKRLHYSIQANRVVVDGLFHLTQLQIFHFDCALSNHSLKMSMNVIDSAAALSLFPY